MDRCTALMQQSGAAIHEQQAHRPRGLTLAFPLVMHMSRRGNRGFRSRLYQRYTLLPPKLTKPWFVFAPPTKVYFFAVSIVLVFRSGTHSTSTTGPPIRFSSSALLFFPPDAPALYHR